MSSTLAFLAADTVGMTLLQKDGVIWGEDVKDCTLGPWMPKFKVRVDSDVLTTKEMSFWIRLSMSLWVYLIVEYKGAWMLIFDGEKVGITSKTIDKFGGKTVKDTIKLIAPNVKGLFYYSDSVKWQKARLDNIKRWTE